MPRKSAGTVIMLVGVAFIATVLGNQLFTASSSWERLSGDLRPTMTDQSIATLRSDAQRLTAVSEEFASQVVPTVTQALGITPDQLARFAADFPATAAGALALPEIAERARGQVDLLAAQQRNFERADAMPTDGTASTSIPWFILLTGVAAVVIGIAMQRPGRLAARLGAVLGVVMLTVPLATSLPGKATDADRLNEAMRPVFTTANVVASREAIRTVQAMAAEIQAKLVPTLAQQLQLTPEQAQAFVGQNFPAIAASFTALPAALQRSEAITNAIEANLDEYGDVATVTNASIAWTVVAGGFATILFAGFGLALPGIGRAQVEAHQRGRSRRAA